MSEKQNVKGKEAESKSSSELLADRRRKLDRLREEFEIDPFGQRTDGLLTVAGARNAYDQAADEAHKENADVDDRPIVRVAGRVVQHRVMGNLIFMSIRDETGDIQLAVSKKMVGQPAFKLAKLTDLSDIVFAEGPLATTKTGEISVWATSSVLEEENQTPAEAGFQILTKSLALPPGKFHGLQDQEQRYRKRYVDLYANPDVMQNMKRRSQIIKGVRDFLTDPPKDSELSGPYLEVETPMMQSIPGGAAARPFVTHHNALDIELYLRIAPELYLKRLLVGGMLRVFEINRNFRNEGLSPRHNPEFTMLELYEAFGDLYSIMNLVEKLFQHVADTVCGGQKLMFGDVEIDYSNFRRAKYLDLFVEHNGFDHADHEKLVEKAKKLHIDPADFGDHDQLLNTVWEETVEEHLVQPTFVIDYPASLCPLTKRKPNEPEIAERFELFIAKMELANAYTELNDPDVQEENFSGQVEGLDEEEAMFRNVDEDFLEALKVGMPPAGGLGIGIDRMVMLLTNQRSIRDVILFPLMKPQG
ncbi:lysine--tRNA ligase [Poriferisphaera sp. WC338]|uniref:lysine--tRNA ligase n=1 Tax=Poriferisphaera sp. WC338 TaxID=3425129 RepID=UPI003D813A3C